MEPGATLMRGLLEAFVLERLEAAPTHGYALIQEMEARFGATPNRNTIYPLLARLESEGMVRSAEDLTSGRGKTVYALTDAGRDALDAYRRGVPREFRDAIGRLWPATRAPAPPPAAAPAPAPAAAPAPAPAPAAPAPAIAPYPCPDARLEMSKEPRSGALTVTLTGCPMGAFTYCPECPVFEAVAGLRRVTFG